MFFNDSSQNSKVEFCLCQKTNLEGKRMGKVVYNPLSNLKHQQKQTAHKKAKPKKTSKRKFVNIILAFKIILEKNF